MSLTASSSLQGSKYPPAELGALLEMGPLEAAVGVADVVRHEVTLFDPAFLLQRQLANTSQNGNCGPLGLCALEPSKLPVPDSTEPHTLGGR